MKKLLFLLLAIISTPLIEAQSNSNTTEITINIIGTNKPNRPHAPSAQEIICTYTNECFEISFRYPEGICQLTITDSYGYSSDFVFDSSSDAVIPVGNLTSATILITTENGHSYQGVL